MGRPTLNRSNISSINIIGFQYKNLIIPLGPKSLSEGKQENRKELKNLFLLFVRIWRLHFLITPTHFTNLFIFLVIFNAKSSVFVSEIHTPRTHSHSLTQSTPRRLHRFNSSFFSTVAVIRYEHLPLLFNFSVQGIDFLVSKFSFSLS